ncbi:unnamed protein product [Merluccius merluccius]
MQDRGVNIYMKADGGVQSEDALQQEKNTADGKKRCPLAAAIAITTNTTIANTTIAITTIAITTIIKPPRPPCPRPTSPLPSRSGPRQPVRRHRLPQLKRGSRCESLDTSDDPHADGVHTFLILLLGPAGEADGSFVTGRGALPPEPHTPNQVCAAYLRGTRRVAPR